MSHDLFAAFGEPESKGDASFTNIKSETSEEPSTLLFDHAPDDDDDFGDFEDASVQQPTQKVPDQRQPTPQSQPSQLAKKKPLPFTLAPKEIAGDGRHPFAAHMDLLFSGDDDEYDAGADEMTDLANNPEAAMAYSKRIIAAQQEEQARRKEADSLRSQPIQANDKATFPPRAPAKIDNQMTKDVRKKDPNVLFDADDVSEADDDDFGDFEGGSEAWASEAPKPKETPLPNTTTPNLDLLSLDDSFNAWDDVPTSDTSIPEQNSIKSRQGPAVNKTETNDDDPWDDFDDAVPSQEPFSDSTATTKVQQHAPVPPVLAKMKSSSKSSTAEPALPPTNVPPPAIILSIAPYVFTSADEALFIPLSKLDMKQRQMLLCHQATSLFLKGYLNHTIAIAHIIAGRKHRWKRDQRLAQSMRIGAAGSKGGMKLTGLDKSEVAKEDREVLDVVRLWKIQVGKLRSALASLSTIPGAVKLSSVPDITEQMPVKALKSVEGGFTAPAPCALCGLKREERVLKVDVDIDDSFGEWWVESMSMHITCRDFWEEQKGKLKSR